MARYTLISVRTKESANRARAPKNVTATQSLKVKDFQCRFLIVDDIWIPLGESLLIAKFAPIWNTLIDGFGNLIPAKAATMGCVQDGMFFILDEGGQKSVNLDWKQPLKLNARSSLT